MLEWNISKSRYESNIEEWFIRIYRWIRKSCKKVCLKYLQDITDEFLTEVKFYLINIYDLDSNNGNGGYGLFQNPDTKVYILDSDLEFQNGRFSLGASERKVLIEMIEMEQYRFGLEASEQKVPIVME
ncbi:uncharacterized protein OCT59_002627 [Rhizophagus irregularis]|uniref:uncharacterized protein n=1 Tax=Rhizophagus irregularis TaxID=588596 RepID=UPI0033325F6D|nr:hypothetical protein OCT59_002627 [Rhizophagus irregularis]